MREASFEQVIWEGFFGINEQRCDLRVRGQPLFDSRRFASISRVVKDQDVFLSHIDVPISVP